MAVTTTNPLFLVNFTELLTAIRCDGLLTDPDTASECRIIEEALRKVRLGFFQLLGASRVADIQAIAYEPNPTTDDDLLRFSANMAELLWVKKYLFKDLPLYFLDSSGRARENWNEEGLLRHMSQDDIDKALRSICQELDLLLTGLAPDSTTPLEITCKTIGPATTPFKVGQSALTCLHPVST